ncbi:hypothetical protein [Nocardioides sp.]|uniref:hypothetical protein n=1 Tax=Nocardioides sp. TaxID=35761 RepID=UPI003518A5F6
MRTRLTSPLATLAVGTLAGLGVVVMPAGAHAADTPPPTPPVVTPPIDLPPVIPGEDDGPDPDPEIPCGAPAVDPVIQEVLHPETVVQVPAQTHTEWSWARTRTITEAEFAPADPAAGDSVWQDADLPAPDGFTATGATREVEHTESPDGTMAEAPEGEGWAKVEGSAVEIVDVEAYEDYQPAWVEDVVVDPGSPAGEPCVDDGGEDPGTGSEGDGGSLPGSTGGQIGDALTDEAPPADPVALTSGLTIEPAVDAAPAPAPAAVLPTTPLPSTSTPVVITPAAAPANDPSHAPSPGLIGLGVLVAVVGGGAVAWRSAAQS